MAEKLSLVDMIGIGNLLEPLVAEDIITCEERDRIILRIAKDNEIDEYRLSVLAGYKRSKAEVLARMEQRKQSKPQHKKQDDRVFFYCCESGLLRRPSPARGN